MRECGVAQHAADLLTVSKSAPDAREPKSVATRLESVAMANVASPHQHLLAEELDHGVVAQRAGAEGRRVLWAVTCVSRRTLQAVCLSRASCLVLRAVQVDEQELVVTQRRLKRLTVGAEQEVRVLCPVLRLEASHKRVRCNDRVLLWPGGQRGLHASEEAQASQQADAEALNHLSFAWGPLVSGDGRHAQQASSAATGETHPGAQPQSCGKHHGKQAATSTPRRVAHGRCWVVWQRAQLQMHAV